MVNYSAAITMPFSSIGKFSIAVALEFAQYFVMFVLLFAFLPGEIVRGNLVVGNSQSSQFSSMLAPFPGALILLLLALVFQVAASLVSTGYGLQCAKHSLNGKCELPSWKDWPLYLTLGFKSIIISVLYVLPSIIMFSALFYLSLDSFSQAPPIQTADGFVRPFSINQLTEKETKSAALMAGVLSAPLFLLTMLFVPMAVMNFVGHDKFSAAFRFGEVASKVFRWKFIRAFVFVGLYSLVLFAAVRVLISLLKGIAVFGDVLSQLIAAIVGAMTLITTMTVWGEVYPSSKKSVVVRKRQEKKV